MAQYDNPNKPFILDLTARPEDKPKTANKLPDTPIDITKPEEPYHDACWRANQRSYDECHWTAY